MILRGMLLLLWCTDVAHGNQDNVTLDKGIPLLRTMVSHNAELLCCYNVTGIDVEPQWMVTTGKMIGTNYTLLRGAVDVDNPRVRQGKGGATKEGLECHVLQVQEVSVNDTGLYWCNLHHKLLQRNYSTPGTFLQVYEPMPKFLDISECVKNRIILTEAVLLLLCVLVPGIPLLCKKRKLVELEKKKKKGEEENIYEGLNLEDLSSTYHQIQRSQVRGPYQDVDNLLSDDIQLEKP